MTVSRPDPDVLLARVRAEKEHRRRGKLKVFFGAAPGVGKTYSMLEAGRTLAKDGADVVVGYVEPHSRPDTQALVLGLDVLPRREGNYRGMVFRDFDLGGALARRPQVLLLDELAHTNAPGATHTKRWQDVVELLDAGIDVYTTVNVQHLESLNDIVTQITRITVRETVPDSIFDQADDVELVDLAPDDLLERLREGKVYVPRDAERAIQNFFTKGNLIALRELALRKVAERVGSQMEDYRELHAVTGTWAARDRLLVCVGPSPFAARLVRATRRMANSLHAPWIAVHVETPAEAKLSEADRNRLAQTLQLAEQLGGETAALSGHNLADELVHFARKRNVTKIVAGKPQKPRWKEWLGGSLVYELTRKCGDIDVYVISGDAAPLSRSGAESTAAASSGSGYAWAVSIVAACTAVGWLLSRQLAPANLVMVYLLGVVATSLRFGRGPSILASFLSVAAFDFFFVPPSFTFAVHDTEYLITFVVMLLTAIVISTLTGRVKFQAESARRREQRTTSLYAISRELAATQTQEQIARAAVKHTSDAAGMRVAVLMADRDRQLVPLGADIDGFVPSAHDAGVARWALEHGQIAGKGTATLPGSEGLYLPLKTSHGTVGLLCIEIPESRIALIPEQLPLIETIAGLVAMAIERAALAAEAERIRLQVETERLRSSLLSAVSHDLRTPLSVITGAVSTLLDDGSSLSLNVQRELLTSVLGEAVRLNRLVGNLLDMTRLEAGALEVKKEWLAFEEIVGAVLTRLSETLKDRIVAVRVPPDLPMVPVDDLLMQQVIVNLLENSAKYSPAPSRIEIAAESKNGVLEVMVADGGPGLPSGDLERVFDKFYRGSQSGGRPGAGLGLAICRGVVELHGGRIWAENRREGGTAIRFTLPLTVDAKSNTEPGLHLNGEEHG